MHLEHFSKAEFRDSYLDMSPRLLTLLDVLRFQVKAPITISPVDGALGRRLGSGSQSAHNIDHWGQCLAVDFFISGIYSKADSADVVDVMMNLGFTGIGVYADTTNHKGEMQVMFHGDVRPTAAMGQPAMWGRVKGEYVAIEEALQALA